MTADGCFLDDIQILGGPEVRLSLEQSLTRRVRVEMEASSQNMKKERASHFT